jgi:hypothetical protein
MTRAMARRAVMNESSKWRSGLACERVGFFLPSGLGGKGPHPFGHNEGVAAQSDGDMVMPTAKAAAFEMVEAELALEILVHALGAEDRAFKLLVSARHSPI